MYIHTIFKICFFDYIIRFTFSSSIMQKCIVLYSPHIIILHNSVESLLYAITTAKFIFTVFVKILFVIFRRPMIAWTRDERVLFINVDKYTPYARKEWLYVER